MQGMVKDARQHVLFHHRKANGWITFAQKKTNGEWRQYHYQPEELPEKCGEWTGENVFFSQNTFFKPQRRIENIRQLRSLYVDIDCYAVGLDPHWVLEKMKMEVFRSCVPEPNIIIFSGRGLAFIWLIEPVPFQALPLWKAVQSYFYKQFEEVGADKKSIDPTRVFRMAGSINSKNGKVVNVRFVHNFRYSLRDLQSEFLPELGSKQIPLKLVKREKDNIIHLHNLRNLYHLRLLDLIKLAELRNYDLKGYREIICFLYRYWSCCFTEDTKDSLDQMLEFNNSFKEPLLRSEVIRATRSAEKAWKEKTDEKANEIAIAKGYPGAGYNLTNKTLIEWLDITEEEQRHLKTIIGTEEKKRRKRERDRRSYRDKKGCVSREEYLLKQRNITEERLWQLETVLARHPGLSNREVAQKLSISESYVRKLKLKLKS